jgi:hypothetical protein
MRVVEIEIATTDASASRIGWKVRAKAISE